MGPYSHSPPPGWYRDPSGVPGQRYWDGTQWTNETTHVPARYVPSQPAPTVSNRTKVLLIVAGVVGVVVLMIIGTVTGDKAKEETRSFPSSRPSVTTTIAPTPTGPVRPEGVNFTTQPGSNGEIVTAQFQIADALFMSFTKTLARSTSKEILRYARAEWPQAGAVVVQGRFQTTDPYGNAGNSVVLNVTYLRDVMERINFDGVIQDIWAIRSSGFVHPELQ